MLLEVIVRRLGIRKIVKCLGIIYMFQDQKLDPTTENAGARCNYGDFNNYVFRNFGICQHLPTLLALRQSKISAILAVS